MNDELPQVSLKSKIIREVRRFLVLFLYLWVILAAFAVHKAIIFQPSHVMPRLGFAFFNALVLAKVMLLAEDLHLGERFHFHRLIYAIVFNALLFSIVLVVFDVAEEVILGHLHGKDVAQSLAELGGGSLIVIVSIAVILFVALLPLFAFREVGRVIGEDKLPRLIFTRLPQAL